MRKFLLFALSVLIIAACTASAPSVMAHTSQAITPPDITGVEAGWVFRFDGP